MKKLPLFVLVALVSVTGTSFAANARQSRGKVVRLPAFLVVERHYTPSMDAAARLEEMRQSAKAVQAAELPAFVATLDPSLLEITLPKPLAR
jgi:hypothetical protein